MYLAIIIPLIILVVLAIYTLKNEGSISNLNPLYLIPIPVVLMFVFLFRVIFESSSTSATEYRGFIITESRYYEYWSTWVEQTCSRQVPCGENCTTDSNGNTTCTTIYCTEYYDCSYCDENPAYWETIDNRGKSYNITENYFSKLIKQWGNPPVFNDLNRRIEKNGGCGVDGNMFRINWDGNITSSESSVVLGTYKNILKKTKSTFNYSEITNDDKIKYGLYDYPKQYEFYKQNPILGLDSIKQNIHNKKEIIKYYEYLNSLGYRTYNKTFVLLFPDKDISVATHQESYWNGGNRNELIICIGYDSKTFKLNWVKPFSWTDNKRVIVDVREDLMQIDTLDLMKFFPKIHASVTNSFKPKDFKDFDYLEIDYPTWTYWFVWVMSLIITIVIVLIIIKQENEYR